MSEAVREVEIPGLTLFRRGKVRDTFDLGDRLLMVATDRLSAFDCILPDLIPDRGRILTRLARHWFEATRSVIPNHLLPDDPSVMPEELWRQLGDRCMLVVKAKRIDIECVVRGRLAGSGWAEYHEAATLAGEALPAGLGFGDLLGAPRFTPATKNDEGHDENITRADLRSGLGNDLANRLEEASVRLFQTARDRCRQVGLELVDTKFEFGMVDGELRLIDEILTPDSSRFWQIGPGGAVAGAQGFDKQPVRDWLVDSGWNRLPPAPGLPPELIAATRQRYLEVLERITGSGL